MNTHVHHLRATLFLAAVLFSTTTGAVAKEADELDATPEGAVRRFLAAMAEGKGDAIERAMLPHPDAAILFAAADEKRPTVDAKQLTALPLQRLKQGDKVKLPGGKTLVLDETYVNDERAQITSFGDPLPFIVVKVESEWLINADPVITGRRAAARRTKPAALPRYRWTNDAESLKRLDSEVTIGDYAIRPPVGFEFSELVPTTWRWTSKDGENRGATLVVVTFDHSRPNDPPSPEESLKSTMQNFSARFNEWKTTTIESGEIGGMKFARTDWAGLGVGADLEHPGTEKVHGFMCVTVDGQRIVAIVHRSIEPNYRSSFQACESAALTWRKAKSE